MFEYFGNFVMMSILWIIGLTAAFLYFRNLYFAVQGAKAGIFSVKLLLRYAGLFFPVLGIVMGAISPQRKVLGGVK